MIFAADQDQDNYIIRNNQFINGSIALNLITSGVFTQPQGNILLIESNTFSQQLVNAVLSNHNNLVFNNNIINSNANSAVSMHIKFNTGNRLEKNKFLLTGLNSTAINLQGADGSLFVNLGIVSNNFIVADKGIDINTGSGLIYMFYNSIISDDFPILVQANINESTAIQIQNNILVNSQSGPAVFIAPNAIVDISDFNDFVNTSGDLLDWQGSQYANLADFQMATSFDANSTTTTVNFVDQSIANLHLSGNSLGDVNLSASPLALVVDDYDNDFRSATVPYMGADESASV